MVGTFQYEYEQMRVCLEVSKNGGLIPDEIIKRFHSFLGTFHNLGYRDMMKDLMAQNKDNIRRQLMQEQLIQKKRVRELLKNNQRG